MCWTATNTNNLTALTADDDISVFKVVYKKGRKIYSYYHFFCYDIGSTHTQSTIRPNRYNEIYYGFHSYDSDKVITKKRKGGIDIMCKVNNCLYRPLAFLQQTEYQTKYQLHRMDCIIPKGSTYYVNELGEYVSDKLKVIGIAPLKEE